MIHLLNSGTANIVLVAIVVALLVHVAFELLQKRNVRREIAGDGSEVAAQYGLTKVAAVLRAYSEGRSVDFLHSAKALVKEFGKNSKSITAELTQAISNIAGTPDGLKMLQEAVAKATAVAPAA